MKTPILFIGDSPSAQSGLGRILRDIAMRLHANAGDMFDVATMGYGGNGDRALPFPQYTMESMKDWFLPTLPDVWQNFAGERQGVIMTIWDASRLLWFARPENPQWCPDRRMRAWLADPVPAQKWGYFPMDATGPHGNLSVMLKECLAGYDRVLAYSKWAETMIRRSFHGEHQNLSMLPHGIDTDVFQPYSRYESRRVFTDGLHFKGPRIQPEERLIGIVATNQTRKDYGLAMETLSRLDKSIPFRIYIQTDILEKNWSIPALLMDYGLMDKAIVNTNQVTDATMARIYSACDLTLGIGAGEGFGYPIFESLACGTPVITGSYGGHAEWLHPEMLVTPRSWRVEGLYNQVRPVFEPERWTLAIERKLARRNDGGVTMLPPALDWKNLWGRWEGWFRSGLEECAPEAAVSSGRQTLRPPVLLPESPSSMEEIDTEPAVPRT